MRNPLRGVVTSEHEDDGGYRRHRGRDIGTRDLNNLLMPVWVYGVGRPVYAAFSGWWVDIVRWSKPGNRSSTWAPTRTGNGGYIRNPDGEAQGYNHVAVLSKWSEGDWIEEGDLIGHLDLSGNMSAPHLHFETWANWRDPYSDFSPKILFDKYGINTMDDPAATITPAGTTTSTGDLTVSEAKKIMDELGQLRAQISNGYGGLRNEHAGLEEEIAGLSEKVDQLLRLAGSNSQVAAWVKDHDGTDVQTRQSLLDAETHRASLEAADLLRALVTQNGLDADQIARTTSQAITESKEN